ncbi:hypothetical protein OG738_01115 [Amycolatopsis sp. NBC_01488]|uniref:hypothetical protein n=1 Tax=Amycolatopsis sp. NBC_01488 TaxID=2903563 RepID=UPI002E2D1EBD|nr:hypothetical protein [Amycolatopsis sp. NBC_01488]
MPEPFTMSLIWLGQAAGAAIVGRLAERGVDRLLDGRRQTVLVPDTPAAPRRHRLGDVTSDVDIFVRHRTAPLPRSVLLAFQTAPRDGELARGVTVPMVLGETAHLTLPRDDYLISALVLDPPADLGGKPVLHGVGWVRHWVASNGTERLTIASQAPTQQLLEKLGLRSADGTSPFEIAPRTTTPSAAPRQLPSAGDAAAGAAAIAAAAARHATFAASANRFGRFAQGTGRRQCRAAISRFGGRCFHQPFGIGNTGLCMTHYNAFTRGETVYDWSTRQPIT